MIISNRIFTGLILLGALSLSACDKMVKGEHNEKMGEAQASSKQAQAMDTGKVTAHPSNGDNNTWEYTLGNGLKLIVRVDKRAPIVVAQVWYKAGSSYEVNGRTGVAHVLEHMMFKGTKKHGPNEFSRIIAENGGSENAFTGQDYTAYFQRLEKSRLPISFELESDRMENLILSEDEFAKEIKVVMEERRMRTDDKPQSLTYEQFNAAAFVNSPYHHPVIGWMDDLQSMTYKDAQAWYHSYYAPNNATLVVVGDVEPTAVLSLAEKYYGVLKPHTIPKLKPQVEIPQLGQRNIVVKVPAQLPYLIMGYKVPVVATAKEAWEPYALDMLAGILDGGDSARFAKNLVRGSQVVANAGAGYDPYARIGDLFTIDATPSKGVSMEKVKAAINEQIEKLKKELVPQKELDKIRAQVVASKTYEKDSVFYQAMQIGTLETVGLDWRLMDQYVDKISAVTPEQVQAVAKKYLVSDQLTVAELDPQPIDAATAMRQMQRGNFHGH